jgi:hypothetical protein
LLGGIFFCVVVFVVVVVEGTKLCATDLWCEMGKKE